MASTVTAATEQEGKLNSYSRLDRFLFWLVSILGFAIIHAVGRSLRWQADGWENFHAIQAAGKRAIFTFWHGRIFAAIYFWRRRGIVVMTSQNRDGEYIVGVTRRFGYGAARGSSTRGGIGALAEMLRELRKGRDVAFTIDGPTGPRYVAKPGAVWLASRSGAAIFPFCVSAQKKWVLKSWDHFQIPKPFSRAVVLMGEPICVAREAQEEELAGAQQQLQASLDELRERSDSYWR